MPVYTYRRTTGILDNLLREYAGTHYSYDAYGNLSEPRFNPASLECYSGRTSGYADPETNVQKRGSAQADLNAEGFMPPVLDKSSISRDSIRGREQ